MPLSCRFYSDRYPEIDDVVMVNVRSIEEMGAYVHLLEYNNIEGMILLSELSRRRIRSINKLIRIGKTEPVVVIRVDRDKGSSFLLYEYGLEWPVNNTTTSTYDYARTNICVVLAIGQLFQVISI